MTARQSLTAIVLQPVPAVGAYVTKQGTVTLAGHAIKVLELSDGRKVLDAEDLIGIFEPPRG